MKILIDIDLQNVLFTPDSRLTAKYLQPRDFQKIEKYLEKELAKNPSKSFYTQEEIDLFFDVERDKIAQILGYHSFMHMLQD